MAVFNCDTCHHEMETRNAHVGKSAKCPSCGQVGTVTPDPPQAPADSEPEPPGEPAAEIPPFTKPPAYTQPRSTTPAPMTAPPDAVLPTWASVTIALAFLLLGIGTATGVLLLFASLAAATGAPQEAAAGAIFAALFIAGYIVARSVEKVTRAAVGR